MEGNEGEGQEIVEGQERAKANTMGGREKRVATEESRGVIEGGGQRRGARAPGEGERRREQESVGDGGDQQASESVPQQTTALSSTPACQMWRILGGAQLLLVIELNRSQMEEFLYLF